MIDLDTCQFDDAAEVDDAMLDHEIQVLKQQIKTLRIENYDLSTTALHLQEKLEAAGAVFPTGDTVTLSMFMSALMSRLGRSYGWRNAYLQASLATGLQAVSAGNISTWQRSMKVPRWAFDQIKRMEFPPSPTGRGIKRIVWTAGERHHLEHLYRADPERTNQDLADECSIKFGRRISEAGVKGGLDRARKRGTISMLRTADRMH